MEFTGKLENISRTWEGKVQLTFSVNEKWAEPQIEKIKDCEKLSIKAFKYRDKRSLDANAYFHVLVDKLRQVLGISFSACKNQLITDYGQVEYIDGEQVVIKTNIKPQQMAEQETLHCKPVRLEFQGDKAIWFYRVYRGSHTYDTREMSMLINGAVAECKEQGIETLPPDKIKEMEAAWRDQS